MHFLLDVFHINAVPLVSVINDYHINGLYLFWDTLVCVYIYMCVFVCVCVCVCVCRVYVYICQSSYLSFSFFHFFSLFISIYLSIYLSISSSLSLSLSMLLYIYLLQLQLSGAAVFQALKKKRKKENAKCRDMSEYLLEFSGFNQPYFLEQSLNKSIQQWSNSGDRFSMEMSILYEWVISSR